ncbi:hypothetical protein NGB36_05225 [Streptomyces sp. RB6PN25]|uniref:Uncharacterized protein n=1 Tax=Streptomyces humicola TaxID=2953240 RepID=A0ABT1PQR1_9ACTN|nr:hypothetical protein [Streptomyces humicola]MCQ4080008.1 hypothetical protein [Streptomyces humicola]
MSEYTWSTPVKLATDISVSEVGPNAPNDPSKALRAGSKCRTWRSTR